MKLTYRGIQYNEEKRDISASAVAVEKKELIYRGNSSKARINPRFPWLKYIQQLFNKSKSQSVFDPITFWYDHKRQFLKDCLHLDDIEKLNRAFDLTLQIERAKATKPKQKTKLKYRGVTYYR